MQDTSQTCCKRNGLLSGTPVIIGLGDVPASAGVGAIHNNQTSTIIGTTCHIILLAQNLFFPKTLVYSIPNNQWLRTMINVAGTTNLDWIVKNFSKNN